MTETDMSKLEYSDLSNQIENYSVDKDNTDGINKENKETSWINTNWSQYFGYYKKIPELAAAIDAKATWTVGNGFKADEPTMIILDQIKGNGIDTFNTILENMIRTYQIGGDAFAEIISNEEGVLINLKPLDPGTIKIIANKKGVIIRYEQVAKVNGKKQIKKFKPEEIFHLSRNRVADEIHGQSLITQVEEIILMRNEAMSDWRRVLHRNIEPLWIFHLDTDDTSQIAQFKAKMDAARGKGENMYIPKGAVVPELVSTATNSTLNPLNWIETLNQYFFQAVGIPSIILGNSSVLTEASAKIAYLAFEQNIKEEQLYIEEEVLSQLNYLIELSFPASLENELISEKKEEPISPPNLDANATEQINPPDIEQPKGMEPNDLKTNMGGNL